MAAVAGACADDPDPTPMSTTLVATLPPPGGIDAIREALEFGIEQGTGVTISRQLPRGLPAGIKAPSGTTLVLAIESPGPPKTYLLHFDVDGPSASVLPSIQRNLMDVGLKPAGETSSYGRMGTLFAGSTFSVIISVTMEAPELEMLVVEDQLFP